MNVNTTVKSLTPNLGNNCTVHQICASANGYDPCWAIGFCKTPNVNTAQTTMKGVVVAAPSDSDAAKVLVVGKLQPVFHHPEEVDPQHNSWYNALLMILGAGQINESCYACTLFPTNLDESIFVKPQALTLNETRCLLCSMTNLTKRSSDKNTQMYSNWWVTNSTECSACSLYNNLPVRANISTAYEKDQGLTTPVMSVVEKQVPETHPVCFERHQTHGIGMFLGNVTGCDLIITGTCGRVYNLSTCNVSNTPDVIKVWKNVVYGPSDDGGLSTTLTMWLCDRHLYQILPPFWTGRCAMVFLNPTVSVHSSLQYSTHHYPHYRPKREAPGVLMTSEREKFMSGLFPWWGSVNNAHDIDKLHVQLENLTTIMSQGFAALGPFAAAVRTTLLQHRLALDILLASQGGLCHVIGDKCCTFIPDVKGNISITVEHLNDLLVEMKKDDVSTSSGWNLWDWLTSGSWREKLISLIVPVLVILMLLCCCSMCIMPLISRMINSMLSLHVQAYMSLNQHEDMDNIPIGAHDTDSMELQGLPDLFPVPKDYYDYDDPDDYDG
ncbi:hypothetical protein PAMP_000345 [Pampus punctatissimus]